MDPPSAFQPMGGPPSPELPMGAGGIGGNAVIVEQEMF